MQRCFMSLAPNFFVQGQEIQRQRLCALCFAPACRELHSSSSAETLAPQCSEAERKLCADATFVSLLCCVKKSKVRARCRGRRRDSLVVSIRARSARGLWPKPSQHAGEQRWAPLGATGRWILLDGCGASFNPIHHLIHLKSS